METQPLISCLCVTSNRPKMLYRAIHCFISQTWERKELVILHRGDEGTTALVRSFSHLPNIIEIIIPESEQITLGEMRNQTIRKSNGDYFCQWDDDDWYSDLRLERQMDALVKSKKTSCALAKQFIYDTTTGDAYLSPIGPWAATILCKKDIINEKVQYPPTNKSEDAVFLVNLLRINSLFPLLDPNVYIYCFHGKNTWDKSHFDRMFRQSKKLSAETSALFRKIFEGEISNKEASVMLNEQKIADEIDYFYSSRPTVPELAKMIIHMCRVLFVRVLSFR